MRRTLAIALVITAFGTVGCGDGTPVRDITPDPTTATAPTLPTTTPAIAETTSLGGDADPAALAPATLPDVSDPVLASYQPALDGLDSVLGTEGTTAALVRIQIATPTQAWSPEMLAALFASFCNDWESDDSAGEGVGPLTEQGRSDWAAAIVAPLHLSPFDARSAVDWALADVAFTPPCQ